MSQGMLMLEPGSLWTRVREKTRHALRSGALQPIPTECELIAQGSISFLIRILPTLGRKDNAKKQQAEQSATPAKEFNPFLPYDQELFVADISQTHVCLLNKFNVVDHHLLIVTRLFEAQETWLTLPDFEALWACLGEIEGLVFYNAGQTAGASQRHKHLQLVPLPLTPAESRVPIAPLLTTARFQGSVGRTPDLPFIHAIAHLDPGWVRSPREAAKATSALYWDLLQAVGLSGTEGSDRQTGAYNLLITRQWMLLIPRTHECFESISVNALGFAGTLAVRTEQQLEFLKRHGPMTVLRGVARPVTERR